MSWFAWCLGLIGAIALSSAAHRAGPLAGDATVLDAVQAMHRWPVLDAGLQGVSRAFSGPAGAIPPALAGAGFVLARRWKLLALFALANSLRGISGVVKWVVQRPRPPSVLFHGVALPTDTSFPSGHAFGAALCFGTVVVLVEGTDLPRWARCSIQALSLAVIALVGLGRVYAGVHWPSDVLGAYLWAVLTIGALLYGANVGRRLVHHLRGGHGRRKGMGESSRVQ